MERETGGGMMENEGWWEGKGFCSEDDRLDFACSSGHRTPYTFGHAARGAQVRCPVCGELGPR